MNFDPKYYSPFRFTKEQIIKNLKNAIETWKLQKMIHFWR